MNSLVTIVELSNIVVLKPDFNSSIYSEITSDSSLLPSFKALLNLFSKLIPSMNSNVRLSSASPMIFANFIFGFTIEAVRFA